jgi:hypothetical protein
MPGRNIRLVCGARRAFAAQICHYLPKNGAVYPFCENIMNFGTILACYGVDASHYAQYKSAHVAFMWLHCMDLRMSQRYLRLVKIIYSKQGD